MNTDRISELRKEWEAEEKVAHIHGWDFSHIHDRYEEEDDLNWVNLLILIYAPAGSIFAKWEDFANFAAVFENHNTPY